MTAGTPAWPVQRGWETWWEDQGGCASPQLTRLGVLGVTGNKILSLLVSGLLCPTRESVGESPSMVGD